MGYKRKIIQHNILKELQIRRFMFNSKISGSNNKIDPEICNEELSSLINIPLDKTEEYAFELKERGLLSIPHTPVSYFITEEGITTLKSGKLLREAEELKIQEEFTKASIDVSKSVIQTNNIQKCTIRITLIIAFLSLVALVCQIVLT